jgi:hypothetical protein
MKLEDFENYVFDVDDSTARDVGGRLNKTPLKEAVSTAWIANISLKFRTIVGIKFRIENYLYVNPLFK